MIGIIGHREVPEEHYRNIVSEISTELDKIISIANQNNTQVIIVSSLAEGADRIGALLAIEKGLELITPLPMNADEYEKDFPDSIQEYRDQLKSASSTFVVKGNKQKSYEGASKWIAKHCQLLIAAWDGNNEEIEAGGTAHTVNLRLNITCKQGQTLKSIADYLGPVYHVSSPRNSEINKTNNSWLWPKDYLNENSEDQSIEVYLHSLITFNRKALQLKDSEIQRSLEQLPHQTSQDCSVAKAFACADAQANQIQKKYLNNLKLTVVLAFLAYLLQQSWTTPIGTLLSAVSITVAICLVLYGNQKKFHLNYIEYRALAEALRISYFWKLAGIETAPSTYFLNHHWGSLSWIRSSLNSVWLPSSYKIDLNTVKEKWIDDQIYYYKKQSSALSKRSSRMEKSSLYLFILSGILAITSVAISWFNPLPFKLTEHFTLLSSIVMLLAGVLTHYKHIRAYEENSLRYRAMVLPMKWAQEIWHQTSTKNKQEIIEELGEEAISEVSNWLQTHRARPTRLMNW